MSQVFFNCECKGQRARVQAGWDRPLQYYHLTVFNLDADEDDDESCFYNDLDDPNCFAKKDVEQLRPILDALGIEAPEGFWERCAQQLGNVFFEYVDGKWVQS